MMVRLGTSLEYFTLIRSQFKQDKFANLNVKFGSRKLLPNIEKARDTLGIKSDGKISNFLYNV
jgi:hypothetical protein